MTTTDRKHDELVQLADELNMSTPLAYDMYILAGGDADILRECSYSSSNLASMKCKIIDARFGKLEQTAEEEGREDGCEEGR